MVIKIVFTSQWPSPHVSNKEQHGCLWTSQAHEKEGGLWLTGSPGTSMRQAFERFKRVTEFQMAFPWPTEACVHWVNKHLWALTMNKTRILMDGVLAGIPAMEPRQGTACSWEPAHTLKWELWQENSQLNEAGEPEYHYYGALLFSIMMFKDLIHILLCVTLKCVAIFLLKEWMTSPEV